jgi:phosphinothricin acetyltransferase
VSALYARAATIDDAAAICVIYNEGIAGRAATFETAPRSPDDVRAIIDEGKPIVVVERDARVIAFAKTSATSPRACYARNLEFAVYVASDSRGAGAGRTAMLELVRRAREAGFWKLVSGVFTDNAASRAMLRRVGFREVGTYEKHGQLDGAWRDVIIVELLLR